MPKRKRLIAVISIFVIGLFLLLNFIRQQYVVPILMYHSVYPDAPYSNRLAVSVKTFERQMEFLRKHKYNVMPVDDLATLIKEKRNIPPRTVAITFDDGYKNNYTYAFPLLKKYNIPATIFIIVNEVGRPENDRLGWDEIKIMQDSGLITFGSHAIGPDPLTEIRSEEELRSQIFDSKKILEQKLGREVKAFSYPEGRFTPYIRQLVIDAGYKVGMATNPGRKFSNDDIFALKRLRISENAGNMFVFWAKSCGFYNFIREHRHK